VINKHYDPFDPYWHSTPINRRIKCAEVLGYPKIPIQKILKIFCHSKEQCSKVSEIMPDNISMPIEINENLYFKKFL